MWSLVDVGHVVDDTRWKTSRWKWKGKHRPQNPAELHTFIALKWFLFSRAPAQRQLGLIRCVYPLQISSKPMEWELQLPSLVPYESHDAGIGLACLAGVSQDTTATGSGDAPAAKRWKGKARCFAGRKKNDLSSKVFHIHFTIFLGWHSKGVMLLRWEPIVCVCFGVTQGTPSNGEFWELPHGHAWHAPLQGWPGWRRAAEEALANAPSKALLLGCRNPNWKVKGVGTLSPTIMVQWKMDEHGYIWKVTILLEGPIFDFHDYGRKCRFLMLECRKMRTFLVRRKSNGSHEPTSKESRPKIVEMCFPYRGEVWVGKIWSTLSGGRCLVRWN